MNTGKKAVHMHIETTLSIPADHPAFAGHFPGDPILPGVVLLDAAVQAVLKAAQAETPARPGSNGANGTCQISSAKFLSPVRPGEVLTLTCTPSIKGSMHFDIAGTGRKVATGTLVLPKSF
jgi:3-hydroxyacyl-[acyl-carrier-protein] dehydratase